MAPRVSKSAYKVQLEKFQAALQPTAAPEHIVRTLKEIQCFADSFAGHANRFVCSADMAKVVVEWVVRMKTTDLATDAWKTAYELAEKYLEICRDAPDVIRGFCVTGLYNHVVSLGTPDKLEMRLHIIFLMARFEVTDEHVTLFGRVKRVAMAIVQDMKESDRNRTLLSTAHDVIIELHRKQLVHAARQKDRTRQAALDLFREVFDSSMAILQRSFGFSLAKARQLYATVMETMNADVRLRESELIHLFGDGIDFVEKILSFRDTAPEYCRFAEFFLMFKSVTAEPYASCVRLVCHLMRLTFSSQLAESFFTEVTSLVRSLYATFPSDPSVMKVIVLFACHSNRHFSSLPDEELTAVTEAAIEMIESMTYFIRHCPTGMRAALCRRCPHARQHLADRLISALIHLASGQMKARQGDPQQSAKHPRPTLTVGRVCELARRREKLLRELECEGKGPLQNESVRHCVVWVQRTLAALRQQLAESDKQELVAVLRLAIEQNAVQRYDFIKSDLLLVRLLENCFYSEPSANVPTSALWPRLSVQLLKLLLTLRENPAPATAQSNASVGVILRTIMAYQVDMDEEDRTMTVMQMYTHGAYDRFGFGFRTEPTHDEQLTIMVQEMTIATNYKTSRSITHCFDQLWNAVDVREHCLPLGMALYAFDEQEWEKLPPERMDELRVSLAKHEPKTASERFQRWAALGNISYRRILDWQRALLDRLRLVPLEREDIRNDRLDKMLLEIQFDREAELQDRLEALRLYYRAMVTVLAQDDFQLVSLLPSLTFVSSVLNNTARYYQLNYHLHQATELQLLNLLLVSQRRAERPLDQCVALGFLLEYHQVTEDVLRKLPIDSRWPNFAGGELGTLKALSVRAAELLHNSMSNESANSFTVPENRRYPLLDLCLTLAVYLGSKQSDKALAEALRTIRWGLAHADRLCAEGDLSEDSRRLLKGRAAQIVFRLATDYGLQFPGATPQIAFVRLMLGNFNELQKLCCEHTLMLSAATVEMTVAVVQFMIVRYDTTQYIVGFVEQVLKFAMRRGAGLRVMQLLLLYGNIMVDSEKLDRCETAIRYLDRLLMLRPIDSGKSHSKRVTRNPIDMYSASQPKEDFNHRPVLSGAGNDDGDDGARKVAKKEAEKFIMPNGGGADPVDEQTEVPIEHYLMFGHAPSCDCRFCCNPQYKLMAFKTAALTARLAVLNREPIERTDHYYEAITDHWLSVMEPLVQASTPNNSRLIWCLAGYRSDLLKDVMRTMVQRGMFLVRCGRYGTARMVYERALALSDSKHIVVDRALYEDIRFNLQVVSSVEQSKQDTNVLKRKRSVKLKSYKRFLATRNSSVATGLDTDFGKVQLKTPAKAVARDAARPPPKTVDRVNELLRQSASRRYQRAQGVTDSALTTASIEGFGIVKVPVTSASARKPKTVNIFMDSPPAAPGRSRETKKRMPAGNPSAPVANEKPQSDTGKISANVVNTKGSAVPSGGLQQQQKPIGASKPTQSVYVDFPVLHAANTPKRSGHSSKSNDNRLVSSPSMNGSFRDALVLGKSSGEATKPPPRDESVIVLDDTSPDINTVPDEAIETSFVDSRTQTLTNSALALRTYSDRKRTATGGGTPLAAAGPSSAAKRKPPTVTKVRLRFDDPVEASTPLPQQAELQKDGTKQRSDKPVTVADGNPKKAVRDRGATGGRAKRANARPPAAEVIVLDCSAENAAPDNIATRTRQRRKRN